MPPHELSRDQQVAKDKVLEWFKSGLEDQPIFKLHGFAGTGKTTITLDIVTELNIIACFAAYTGKAALVMRKHDMDASTLHSLIYKPVMPDKEKCNELFKLIKETSDSTTKRGLQGELKKLQQVTFELKLPEESALGEADLLVVDECSMVDEEMKQDLLTFGTPILALGDPGQLPPIQGTGALVDPPVQALLTEIHRQAEGNPIIDYATRARSGIHIPYGEEGDSARITRDSITKGLVFGCDQILTGKNNSRRDLNRRYRELEGRQGTYPHPGEKLICLRNNAGLGIFNGMMCEVISRGEEYDASIEYEIKTELDNTIKVKILRAHFDVYNDKEALNNVKWWERRDSDEFDFGYAITVHKSQGSQWDRVLVMDDKFLGWKPQERKRWLYTAITRAAESVVIADY